MMEEFSSYLRGTALSPNTARAYLSALRQFNSQYERATKKNLQSY